MIDLTPPRGLEIFNCTEVVCMRYSINMTALTAVKGMDFISSRMHRCYRCGFIEAVLCITVMSPLARSELLRTGVYSMWLSAGCMVWPKAYHMVLRRSLPGTVRASRIVSRRGHGWRGTRDSLGASMSSRDQSLAGTHHPYASSDPTSAGFQWLSP